MNKYFLESLGNVTDLQFFLLLLALLINSLNVSTSRALIGLKVRYRI